MKSNQEIRKAITDSKLKYWQIAYQLQMNDGNFSRLLRKELPDRKKEQIKKIILELKEKQQNEQ